MDYLGQEHGTYDERKVAEWYRYSWDLRYYSKTAFNPPVCPLTMAVMN